MTELAKGRLPAEVALLRRYFEETHDFPELRNPHVEPRVSQAVRRQAKPAAVLIGIVEEETPHILVTRRNSNIRFAGHVCFPGGRAESVDVDAVATALRESHEEIALDPAGVEVLGCLGDYYTQTGYCITPVVGLVDRSCRLVANPAEVESIHRISLASVLDGARYRLHYRRQDRGHYSFHESGVRIAGPTVSLMIGLYEALAAFASDALHHYNGDESSNPGG